MRHTMIHTETMTKTKGIAAVLAAVMALLLGSVAWASISEPDVIFYGSAKDNGVVLTNAVVTLNINDDPVPVVTYSLGTDQALGGKYVLRVPMDYLDPRTTSAAWKNDPTKIFIDGVQAAVLPMPERGSVVNLDLDKAFPQDLTGAPDTAITGMPQSPTNQTSATVGFQSVGGTGFDCSLDGAAYAACSSPGVYDGLSDGMHTFLVRARNAQGVPDPTPAVVSWVIDTVAPSSAAAVPVALMTNSYTITGTASDVGTTVALVEISINGGAWTPASGTTSWSYAWSIPSPAWYTIVSRATDTAGNVEIPGAGSHVAVGSIAVSGRQLLVNGNPFMMKGVYYSPVPIGDDPDASAPFGDYFTAGYSALYDRDFALLRAAGVNTVRVPAWDNTADHSDFLAKAYNGGQQTIYVIPEFRIDTGLDIDPASSGNVRDQLKANFLVMVQTYKSDPAILMWSIGNELNSSAMYGADLPNLFSLIDEMRQLAHAEEGLSSFRPVTAPMADTNFTDTVTAYDASVDLWSVNVFRGNSFGPCFDDFKLVSGKPLAIFGYGADAYDTYIPGENEADQADFFTALWGEILVNADACIGGVLMEYSDQWWKGRHATDAGCSDTDPEVHGACSSAHPAMPDGYDHPEWWGIMRPVKNVSGPDTMEPRAVYASLVTVFAPDGQPPTGTVIINGGAAYVNDVNVSLGLTCDDGAGGSGCAEVLISSDGVFDTETAIPFMSPKPWVLAGSDGAHAVYVKFKDNAGNWSGVMSDDIILDTVAPSGALGYQPAGPFIQGTTVTITATFSEPLADAPVVQLAMAGSTTLGPSDMTKVDATHYTYQHTAGAGEGITFVIFASGTDMAGNPVDPSPTAGGSFGLDNTAPATAAAPSGQAYLSSLYVSLNCADVSGSGCSGTYYCLGSGCSPATAYTGMIRIPGSTDLRFYSTDMVGNSEGVTTETYTSSGKMARNSTHLIDRGWIISAYSGLGGPPYTVYFTVLDEGGNLVPADQLGGLGGNPLSIAADAVSPDLSLVFDESSGTAYIIYRNAAGLMLSTVVLPGTFTGGITASPDPLDFGTLSAVSFMDKTVTIQSTGNENQTVMSITGLSAPFSNTGSGTCSAGTLLVPGGSCTVSVRYAPAAAGTHNGSFTVTTDRASVNIDVTGTKSSGGR